MGRGVFWSSCTSRDHTPAWLRSSRTPGVSRASAPLAGKLTRYAKPGHIIKQRGRGLDAVRGEADVYNMGWQKYLDARATDEQRRRRERGDP